MEDTQKDRGFNPAHVWTLRKRGFGGLHGATAGYMRLLAGLDLVYLAGDAIAVTGAAQKRANAEGDEE